MCLHWKWSKELLQSFSKHHYLFSNVHQSLDRKKETRIIDCFFKEIKWSATNKRFVCFLHMETSSNSHSSCEIWQFFLLFEKSECLKASSLNNKFSKILYNVAWIQSNFSSQHFWCIFCIEFWETLTKIEFRLEFTYWIKLSI